MLCGSLSYVPLLNRPPHRLDPLPRLHPHHRGRHPLLLDAPTFDADRISFGVPIWTRAGTRATHPRDDPRARLPPARDVVPRMHRGLQHKARVTELGRRIRRRAIQARNRHRRLGQIWLLAPHLFLRGQTRVGDRSVALGPPPSLVEHVTRGREERGGRKAVAKWTGGVGEPGGDDVVGEGKGWGAMGPPQRHPHAPPRRPPTIAEAAVKTEGGDDGEGDERELDRGVAEGPRARIAREGHGVCARHASADAAVDATGGGAHCLHPYHPYHRQKWWWGRRSRASLPLPIARVKWNMGGRSCCCA
ncbi:hypothetical protein C8R45DRAFT_87241 [Mycena sanguinolenta]|nr:hypothetical protein C8R45DRAFT_87241 [Mycena sanguinolenta]